MYQSIILMSSVAVAATVVTVSQPGRSVGWRPLTRADWRWPGVAGAARVERLVLDFGMV